MSENVLKCATCGKQLLITVNNQCITADNNEAIVVKTCSCGTKNVIHYELPRFQYWIS